MLNSILSAAETASISLNEYLICTACSLVLGGLLALLHRYRNQSSRNFILTLFLLPVIVQTVISIVNGNLGTGVAVMGAFSLVRFRSLPGTSREIVSLFLAMAIGLADGMGFLSIALILFLAVVLGTFIFMQLPGSHTDETQKSLHITIPENMDYNEIFDDLFLQYTTRAELLKVKTVNMGSLFELQYQIALKDVRNEKQFIDALRCRNGNLNITCGRPSLERDTL